MWKQIYKKRYKTSFSNREIICVCSYPNMVDTIDKAVEFYGVKKLQSDQNYLDIMSEFWFHNGRDIIPLYFSDDHPKLENLQLINPVGKGFFWCIGYVSPNYDRKNHKYHMPSFEWFKERLYYWLDNYFSPDSSVTSFLFEYCIKAWVYKNSPSDTEEFKSRRFDVVENKRIVALWPLTQKHQERIHAPEQFKQYIENMEKTNWYEFVFHAFK